MIIKKCNKCGGFVQNNFEIDYRFEYGSRKDGDDLMLHLCYKCLDEFSDDLIERCIHNPVKENGF